MVMPSNNEVLRGSFTASETLSGVNDIKRALEAMVLPTDDFLQHHLKNYTINEITSLLNDLVDNEYAYDKSESVAAVVRNQPYHTYYFREFDSHNADIKLNSFVSFYHLGTQKSGVVFGLLVGTVVVGILLWVSFLLAGVSMAAFSYHEKIYRFNVDREFDREVERLSIAEYKGRSGARKRLGSAKKDYQDAVARISSYELDISKAISFPAFNDVTVSKVSTMVKQLRQCERLLAGVDGRGVAVTDEKIAGIVAAVDDLWVDVTAAEREAKRIAWSNVSASERKDLKLAERLVSQVNDTGNTEELRLVLYSKLKRVIDRLNGAEEIIPVQIVADLEQKAALQLKGSSPA